jgi:hypothetical protein
MAQLHSAAPRLPNAPVEYDQEFMQHLVNVLRLYFNQIQNPGAIILSTQNLGSTVQQGNPGAMVTALSFRQLTPPKIASNISQVTYQLSLPSVTSTTDMRPYLKSGDVYYDTTGSTTGNILKVKS